MGWWALQRTTSAGESPEDCVAGVEPAPGGLDLAITGCNTMNRALPLFCRPILAFGNATAARIVLHASALFIVCWSFPAVIGPTVTPVFLALCPAVAVLRIARIIRSPVKGCAAATHQFLLCWRVIKRAVNRAGNYLPWVAIPCQPPRLHTAFVLRYLVTSPPQAVVVSWSSHTTKKRYMYVKTRPGLFRNAHQKNF